MTRDNSNSRHKSLCGTPKHSPKRARAKLHKRSFLSSMVLGIIAVILCTSFTFSWLSSRVDYLNTIIEMGDFGATVNVYYEDGTLLTTGSTSGDDIVINNAISSDKNWAAGTVGYRFIEVKNTGTINLSSYLTCGYDVKNFKCSDSEVAGSFYLRLTDITKEVKSMNKADFNSKIEAYANKYVSADAVAIHSTGKSFADFDSTKKLGLTVANDKSYYLFEYCCYDLSSLMFSSESSLEINTKIRVQQTAAPFVNDKEQKTAKTDTPEVKPTAKTQEEIEATTTPATAKPTTSGNSAGNGVAVTTPTVPCASQPATTEHYEPVVPVTTNPAEQPTTPEVKPVYTWEYEYTSGDNSTCKILAYNGYDKKVTVPSKIDGAVVTSLGAEVFSKSKPEKVEVPATVSEIDINTFNVSSIKDVKIFEKSVVDDVTYESPYKMEDMVMYSADMSMLLRYNPQRTDKEFAISDKCSTVADNAFEGVKKLKSLDMGVVKSVSATSFKNAEISDFYFHTSDVPYLSSIDTFGKVSITVSLDGETYKTAVKLHVPEKYYEAYKTAYTLRMYAGAKAIKNDGTLGNGTVVNVKKSGLVFTIIKNNSEFDGVKYTSENESEYLAVVTSYEKIADNGVVKVPANVKFTKKDANNVDEEILCPVVGIADGSFENCAELKAMVLPNRDVYYSTNAFKGCDNLGLIQYDSVLPFDVAKFDAIVKSASSETEEDENPAD